MSEQLAHNPRNEASDLALGNLIAEITDRLQRGEVIELERYTAGHPEWAERLRGLLPALQAMADLSNSAGREPADGETRDAGLLQGTLGDFRIVRALGRGGMGIVYEAEQISLGRRVALKTLPLVGVLDPRQVQRFQNEARAAAYLHHPNIVPVHAVGQERGVYFYAMQKIDGPTLAEVVRQLRRARGLDAADSAAPVSPHPDPAADPEEPPTAPYRDPQRPPPGTTAARAETTALPAQGKEYFRAVARLGMQAAEALSGSMPPRRVFTPRHSRRGPGWLRICKPAIAMTPLAQLPSPAAVRAKTLSSSTTRSGPAFAGRPWSGCAATWKPGAVFWRRSRRRLALRWRNGCGTG